MPWHSGQNRLRNVSFSLGFLSKLLFKGSYAECALALFNQFHFFRSTRLKIRPLNNTIFCVQFLLALHSWKEKEKVSFGEKKNVLLRTSEVVKCFISHHFCVQTWLNGESSCFSENILTLLANRRRNYYSYTGIFWRLILHNNCIVSETEKPKKNKERNVVQRKVCVY